MVDWPRYSLAMLSRLPRVLVPLALIAIAPLFLIAACQSKFIYMPRPYHAEVVGNWQQDTRGRPIDFTTSQGSQRAFLQGNLESPRNLWIVCGGNATLALEWSSWLAANGPAEDAWLLVDFPGYGDCDGTPDPKSIRETFQTVIPVASGVVGLTTTPDPSRLRMFGHSLGAAACLITANDFDIHHGVLLAPFTSTMEMSRLVVGVPLGFLVTHRYDNPARLDQLIARGPANLTILHGTHDEVIPARMGRALAEGREDHVRFVEVENGRHNDIALNHPEPLANALAACGAAKPLRRR